MANFRFTQKIWDRIRPPSVKKTGLGDAITKFLKLVPGCETDRLATPEACAKAQLALVDLEKVLSSTLALVKKAPDDKLDAEAELKRWLTDAERGIEAIKDRKIELVEAVTEPARKRCAPLLKQQERLVQDLVSDIMSTNGDAGRAEELLQQAMMGMVERAGELRATGHTGLKPEDFLDDADFRKSHTFYNQQIDIITRSNKALEDIVPKQKRAKELITAMRSDVLDAAEKAGEYVSLPSQNLRAFKSLKADIEVLWRESCSDHARKYAMFCFIPEATPANKVRAQWEGNLATKFAALKKIDADAYFEGQLAMHALNEKQLKKALNSVNAVNAQVKDLVKSISDGKGDVGADKKALKRHADTLDLIVQKLQKGRNNLDMLQFLSKKENADAKKFIDNAIGFIVESSEKAAQAVKDAR